MQITFAAYQHSTIGFPGVVLKWTVENGEVTSSYITVRGIIKQGWTWHNPHPMPFIQSELERFDKMVRRHYGDEPSVQG